MLLEVAFLPGDGVGAEVTRAALDVLHAVADGWGHRVEASEHPIGWAAVQGTGDPLPRPTLDACRAAPAVFLGAVGHPDAAGAPRGRRPEDGLLRLRSELGCFANVRPVRVSDSLVASSALRPEVVRGTDLVIVRELAGGLYYGTPRGWEPTVGQAVNTLSYTDDEVSRIADIAFALARARDGRVTSVDKANVLEVSQLWRRVVDQVAPAYPDVEHEHMLVDRAAMELVLRPSRFDVILTENLFGDILSDAAGALTGSLGVLGSASLGGTTDLYEPVHGSAPDIAGRDVANPIGAMASVALMLHHTFGLNEEADALEAAAEDTLVAGLATADLVRGGEAAVGTGAFTAEVVERLAARRSRGLAVPASTGSGAGSSMKQGSEGHGSTQGGNR